MAIPKWQVSGQYYETCSCDFVCPCLPGGLAVSPTKGWCTFAMAFEVDSGTYGTVSLDGLGFIVLGFTPEAMAKGNWSVGLIGKFLGVQPAPIRFDRSGAKWSVKASDFVDMAAEGAKGINPDATEPMHLDNTGHPAADRFALAHASRSRVQAFDLAWEDESGKNNGQYAPFSWRNP
jgi:hypothetical protein